MDSTPPVVATPIRPVDLPEVRTETVRVICDPRFEMSTWENIARKSLTPNPAGMYQEAFARSLTEGDLYWVSSAMSELTEEGAKTVPEFALQPEDVPSKSGFLLFEKMVTMTGDDDAPMPMNGLAWTRVPSPGGESVAVFALVREHMIAVPLDEVVVGYGTTVTGWWRVRYLRALYTAWLLMRQPLAKVEDVEPDRASRKRQRRAGYEPRAIRVINLRRPKGEPGAGESHGGYQNQWIVRGHWRNHWHPKRQVHRPVWIAPHVKGPEGAPMIGGEKVYAWKK